MRLSQGRVDSLHLPILLLVLFNFLTLAAYVFAPFVFYGENVFLSFVYVFVNILMLYFGYLVGLKKNIRFDVSLIRINEEKSYYFYRWLTVFYACTFLIKYAYVLKYQVTDIDGMIDRILIGLANPKLGYKLSVEDPRTPQVSWSIYFLISIFNSLYFIVGFMVWDKLKIFAKGILIVFVVIDLVYWVGRGINFGVIAMVVIFSLSMLARTKGNFSFSLIIKYFLLLVFAVVAFSLMMNARSEGGVTDLQVFSFPHSSVDENSGLLLFFPDYLRSAVLTVFSYLIQGYYMMSLALQLDFQSTWGTGWNPALVSLMDFFGINFSSNSYVTRLEPIGVDPTINWHSSYTWFANDVSFIGVPLVIFCLGYFLAVSWKMTILSGDIISKIVFVWMAGISIFLFANNNFSANYFYSIIFIFPYWLIRRWA
jgi:hypothetical protein